MRVDLDPCRSVGALPSATVHCRHRSLAPVQRFRGRVETVTVGRGSGRAARRPAAPCWATVARWGVRALTYAAFGAPLEVVEVPEPPPPPGGAVVRVLASGLCRSDWHGWLGHDPDIAVFPHVPGHELAGVVESVGEGVDRGWVGRRVTSPFVMACGRCARLPGRAPARSARTSVSLASPTPGSFAELVVVHAAAPTSSRCRTGSMPGRPPGWAAVSPRPTGRWSRARGGRAGETVVVIGCGGVGLAAVAVARSRGARVCAVDVSADRSTGRSSSAPTRSSTPSIGADGSSRP